MLAGFPFAEVRDGEVLIRLGERVLLRAAGTPAAVLQSHETKDRIAPELRSVDRLRTPAVRGALDHVLYLIGKTDFSTAFSTNCRILPKSPAERGRFELPDGFHHHRF